MYEHNITEVTPYSTGQILTDKKKNGKERPWKSYKLQTLLLAKHYFELFKSSGNDYYLKKGMRLSSCAETLVFKLDNIDYRIKLYKAYFCKVRLCAMCAWRRSLKIAYHNKRIVEVINERENFKWLFLTLTVKNMNASELQNTVKEMFKAWNRFVGYKAFKKSIKGYFRALEITRDRDIYITEKRFNNNPSYYKKQNLSIGDENPNYGTYHPHFHILLCVPSSYFKLKDYYITHNEWTSLWQKAMKLDYSPIVNIQRVKPKENLNDLKQELKEYEKTIEEQKAILEVSKYPVKNTDVIKGNKITTENLETIDTLDEVLTNKRLISYGGMLKEIHKELNLDDAEDGDLVNISEDDEVSNSAFEIMVKWNMQDKNYIIT